MLGIIEEVEVDDDDDNDDNDDEDNEYLWNYRCIKKVQMNQGRTRGLPSVRAPRWKSMQMRTSRCKKESLPICLEFQIVSGLYLKTSTSSPFREERKTSL